MYHAVPYRAAECSPRSRYTHLSWALWEKEGGHVEEARRLFKQGAALITRSEDILEIFGLKQDTLFGDDAKEKEIELANLSKEERSLLDLLVEPTPRDEIKAPAGMSVSEVNTLISVMEIKGLIKEEYGEIRRV